MRRVLGRVFEGDTVSEDGALKIADRLVPGDSWKLDGSLYDIGKGVCAKGEPLCSECPLHRSACTGRDSGRGAGGRSGVPAEGLAVRLDRDGMNRQELGAWIGWIPISAGRRS